MDFSLAHWRWWPVVAALAVADGPAMAQNGAARAGQAILFSTPAGDRAASNAPAFAAPDSQSDDFASRFQAPEPLFNPAPPEPFALPSGGPALSGSQARRLQKTLEDRQNWALLTPEEILGVTTPEKILGGETQDKNSPDPAERFLARQQTGATNGFYNNNPDSRRIFTRDREDGTARLGGTDAAQFLDRFAGALPDNNPFMAQNQDASWFKPPAPALSKPDPEQVAAMDRFRQMLNSGPSSDAPGKSPPGGRFLSAQPPLADQNFQMVPVLNRIGASYTPLSSGISKPVGLTPLPGITQPIVQPVVTPSWLPQPPPWQSQNPQPFTMPQRKF